MVLDYNPQEEIKPEQSLWLWGNEWINNLEWDPREWQWRRLGMLPITSVMNYTTKRGYRIALKQNTQQMNLDLELERQGYNSKVRVKFFNRIWHPYLPRKVSAMQWLVLTEGLPVGAWREKIGLPSTCELCQVPIRETLQHAFQDCPQVRRAWDLFRSTRCAAKLSPSYFSWADISRGLMREPPGPQVEEDLRWDTASAFSLNSDTPWDILRAQLLWSIWCQKVAHTFKDEQFHLGVVLWHAWRNTIYCAMEAYKELFRHKRNEEKRQEMISCFQQIWTAENMFGRLHMDTIKWNITPPQEFLPRELGAWTVPPIRINRLSPSPDLEAEFAARPDFAHLVDEFLQNAGNAWQPARANASEEEEAECSHLPYTAPHQDSSNHLNEESEQRANASQEEETECSHLPYTSPHQGSSNHLNEESEQRANAAEEEEPVYNHLSNTVPHQGSPNHEKLEQSGKDCGELSVLPRSDKVVPNTVQVPSNLDETVEIPEPLDCPNTEGRHIVEDSLGCTVERERKRGTSVSFENRCRPRSRPKKRCFKRNKVSQNFTRKKEAGIVSPGDCNGSYLIESAATVEEEKRWQLVYPPDEDTENTESQHAPFFEKSVQQDEHVGCSDNICSVSWECCKQNKKSHLLEMLVGNQNTRGGNCTHEVSRMENSKHRPCSRAKKRCSKRLRHPSKLHRKGGLRKSQPEFSVTNIEEQIVNQAEKIQSSKEGECQLGVSYIKPSSRPKRRCRFGPRARRKHGSEQLKRGNPFLDDAYNASEKAKDSSVGCYTVDAQDLQTIRTNSSSFREVRTLPDRVTLQPGSRTRRTPFDHYKHKEVVSRQEVNIYQKSAKRLGVSVQLFEDSLNKEIDELLGGIGVPYASEKAKDSPVGRHTVGAQESQTVRTSSPVFSEGRTLPDRVTLQPGPRSRRTPFDRYKLKKEEVVSRQEVNIYKKSAKRLGVSEPLFEDSLTKEIDELLGEIEVSRREALLSAETRTSVCDQDSTSGSFVSETQTLKTEGPNLNSDQSSLRPAQGVTHLDGLHKSDVVQVIPCKANGSFGTKAKRGRERVRTSFPVRRDLPPSPPPFRTNVSPAHDERVTLSFPSESNRIRSTFRDPHEHLLQDQFPQVDEDLQVVLPDRPSLCHFAPAIASPFSRYLGLPVVQPRPPPFRPVHERLGLSEEAFEALLKEEIDEVLMASEEYRRSMEVSEDDLPSGSVQMPPLQVLSKEDCLKIFRTQGYPSSGSLLGVYWWAADLYWTRFNFEFDFARDDLSILNAYD